MRIIPAIFLSISIQLIFSIKCQSQIRADENLQYPRSHFDLQLYDLIFEKGTLNILNAEPLIENICRFKRAGVKKLKIYSLDSTNSSTVDTITSKIMHFDTNGFPTSLLPTVGWYVYGDSYIEKKSFNCPEFRKNKKPKFKYNHLYLQTWKYDSLNRCIRHSKRSAGLINRTLSKIFSTSIVKTVKCYAYSNDGLTVTVYRHTFDSIFEKEKEFQSGNFVTYNFDEFDNLKSITKHSTDKNGQIRVGTTFFEYEFY